VIERAGCRKRSVLRHAHSTYVSVSKAIAFHLILSCRLHLSEPISAAIARATAPSYSPPTPTGFSGNLYYRHKGASGSLLTALSKLTRRSASPLTPTLRRRVSPDSVLTSSRSWLVVWARIDQHRRLEVPDKRGLVVRINREFTQRFRKVGDGVGFRSFVCRVFRCEFRLTAFL